MMPKEPIIVSTGKNRVIVPTIKMIAGKPAAYVVGKFLSMSSILTKQSLLYLR